MLLFSAPILNKYTVIVGWANYKKSWFKKNWKIPYGLKE